MREIKSILRVDDLGRIRLPKEARRAVGIREGSALELIATSEGIRLEKYYLENDLVDAVENLKAVMEDERGSLGEEKTDRLMQLLKEAATILECKG